jgi:hypothetical protein
MDLNNTEAVKAQEKLIRYVKNYKMFIDTCSLLYESADPFWRNIDRF